MAFIFDDLLRRMFGGEKLNVLDTPVITCVGNVVTMTGSGTIYYTTDGTNPTTSSLVYSSPITDSGGYTVYKAYCVYPGYHSSNVTTYVYSTTPTDYFYIQDESGNGGTLTLTSGSNVATDINKSVYYSTDGTNWVYLGDFGDYNPITEERVENYTQSATVQIPSNGRVYLKSDCYGWAYFKQSGQVLVGRQYSTKITADCSHSVGGNILSLIYGDNFHGETVLKNDYSGFAYMFRGNTNLVSSSDLWLPEPFKSSYDGLFWNCSSLNSVNAPFTGWGGYTDDFGTHSCSTSDWLTGSSASGNITVKSGLDTTTRDTSHIPEGWTITTE